MEHTVKWPYNSMFGYSVGSVKQLDTLFSFLLLLVIRADNQ